MFEHLQDLDYSSSTSARANLSRSYWDSHRLQPGTFSWAGEEHNELLLKGVEVVRWKLERRC